MQKFLLIALTSLLFFSCEQVFLPEEPANDPGSNFELFWEDFDQHYGLFQARGWNWDSLYAVYQPQVTAQTSPDQLWGIFSDMISYLDDSHTFIYDPGGRRFFASGSEDDEQVEREFSLELLRSSYIESVIEIPVEDPDDHYLYGKIQGKDIGYIFFNGIELPNPDVMDDILVAIGSHQAIVLDLRNNFGGDDAVAQAIAGRFSDREELVYTVQERNGPAHTDFSEKYDYYTESLGEEHFSKPVVVLTDRITVSAAEVLLLYMKAFDQVTQIGDTTSGDFSDTGMRRFLPNGWQYQYSIMMFLQPDGTSLDGLGHVPDVQIRNSEADILAGQDKVMEGAVQYLFDTYGIQ